MSTRRADLLRWPACCLAMHASVSALAVKSEPDVSFRNDILPVLADRCFACHGPDDAVRQAHLRLDQQSDAMAELPTERRAIVPGNPVTSELLRRITSADPSHRMPPPEAGEPLDDETIDAFRRWIEQGASWETHWSFVAPQALPPPPPSRADWNQPIDRFILARIDEARLTPAPEADRHTLIRRLSLDLVGLPPTPEEVDAFVNDQHPGAYDRVVERLLESPRFGERWASVWLDQARYADTRGYEADRHRTIWPYRDWVIRAVNDDMPFDQFTIEQIAGDLLPNPTPDQLLATAFHRNTMTNDEGGTDDEEFRVAAVVDRVNTTMQVWMGLTAGCAQCHTHKFDPISQREYYRLFDIFNQTADADRPDEAPTINVPTTDQIEQRAALDEQHRKAVNALETQVDAIVYAEPSSVQDRSVPDDLFIWIDDHAPVGSVEQSTTGAWKWRSADEIAPTTGKRSAWLTVADFGQFFATDALAPLIVGEGDTLAAHVWIDPDNPPREIMLQFFSTRMNWEHRAYWGENLVNLGTDGQSSRRRLGNLPPPGEWQRLEVPVADVGLQPGDQITGWAFSQHGGTIGWDAAGLVTSTPQHTGYLTSQRSWERLAATRMLHRLPPDVRTAIAIDPAERDDASARAIQRYYLTRVHRAFAPRLRPAREQVATIEQRQAALEASIPRVPILRAIDSEEQRSTHVLVRGSFLSPGEQVEAGTPEALHAWRRNEPRDRLGFARWLVDQRNPLTARVFVNRVWSRIFGQGLVDTEEDFGVQGAPPSHPQLLDHLALQFMDDGWSLKELCRTIVSTRTYRQASDVTPESLRIDPRNRLLSRGARYRLDAEVVRDQTLAIAGLLSDKMYGPSVYPPQPDGVWQVIYSNAAWMTSTGEDRYRRGLYTYWRRTSPHPAMTTFDSPSREFCVPRRIRTNTPLQALVTLNDPAYVEAAQALARRVVNETTDDDARATSMLRHALSRPPTDIEIEAIVSLVTDQYVLYAENPEAALKMATDPLGPLHEDADPAELAAWTVAANVVLNLDELLMRN